MAQTRLELSRSWTCRGNKRRHQQIIRCVPARNRFASKTAMCHRHVVRRHDLAVHTLARRFFRTTITFSKPVRIHVLIDCRNLTGISLSSDAYSSAPQSITRCPRAAHGNEHGRAQSPRPPTTARHRSPETQKLAPGSATKSSGTTTGTSSWSHATSSFASSGEFSRSTRPCLETCSPCRSPPPLPPPLPPQNKTIAPWFTYRTLRKIYGMSCALTCLRAALGAFFRGAYRTRITNHHPQRILPQRSPLLVPCDLGGGPAGPQVSDVRLARQRPSLPQHVLPYRL